MRDIPEEQCRSSCLVASQMESGDFSYLSARLYIRFVFVFRGQT